MSEINPPQTVKVNASKASMKSNVSRRQQPPAQSNPLDVLTRCGYGSRTEGKRSGLQPLDGDYVPSYDRIYKPSAAPAIDTSRPAGIPTFPHLKRDQEMAQQAQITAQQNQQHSVAEPASPHTQNNPQQNQPHSQQPAHSPVQSGGDCPPAENHDAKIEPQVTEHQSPPTGHQVIPDPHEFVTKCPNCAATLVLSPQMVPCQQQQ